MMYPKPHSIYLRGLSLSQVAVLDNTGGSKSAVALLPKSLGYDERRQESSLVVSRNRGNPLT